MNRVSLSNSLLDKWEENGTMHKEIDFETDIEQALRRSGMLPKAI